MKNGAVSDKGIRHFNEIADQIMAYLLTYEVDFTPRQRILAHAVKNQLTEMLRLIGGHRPKLKKAKRLQFQIDSALVSMWEQNPHKRKP